MKIVVNYELMEKILDVKEPYGLLKLERKNKDVWFFLRVPALLLNNMAYGPEFMLSILAIFLGVDIITLKSAYKKAGRDFFAVSAERNLKKLVIQLNDSHIDTNYDLLLESKESERKYKIKLNEKKLPCLFEEKYILVPTNTQTKDVKETSLLQEHIVGSNEWVLSVGSPSKKKKLVPVHSQI